MTEAEFEEYYGDLIDCIKGLANEPGGIDWLGKKGIFLGIKGTITVGNITTEICQ